MKKLLLGLITCLFWAGTLMGLEPIRRTVVMTEGQTLIIEAANSLITVSAAEGSDDGVVDHRFDQYGSTVRLEGKKKGEAKLLLEFVTRQIGEVVRVVVTDRAVVNRYREVVGAMSGTEGIDLSNVQVVGDEIVIVGDVFSVPDLELCQKREEVGAGKVVCAVRLSSAAPSLYPQFGFTARASIELVENAKTRNTEHTDGIEDESIWDAWIRYGDIPVMLLSGTDRTDALKRASDIVRNLNRVTESWIAETEKSGSGYAPTFEVGATPAEFRLMTHWSYDQGSGGEPLATVSIEQLERAATLSNRSPDLLMQWWVAILQDAFRLYNMAQRPLKTTTETSRSPLIELYDRTLEVRQADIDRASAAISLARGYFSLLMTSENEPFESLLINPPAEFAQAALQSR